MYTSRLAPNGQAGRPPLSKQKRGWIIGAVILGVLLFLLIFAEFIIQSSLRKGWTRYDSNVTALAVDPQGQVWATVFDRNITSLVLYSDDNASTQEPLPNELASSTVLSMVVDKQNRIWAGTVNGFIGMRDINGQWTIYTPENSLGEYSFPVWDLVIDEQDQAWARNGTRLVRIDPASGGNIYSSASSGLVDNYVSGLAVDDKGKLWATNMNGLMVLGLDNVWTPYIFAAGSGINLPLDCVFAFDSQGRIWLATNSGVAAIELDGAWQSYPLGDPAPNYQIKDIVVDDQGRVWAFGYQGLFRFDPGSGWTTYNQRNSSFSSNSATSLAVDGQGRLWMGSFNNGLSRFDPAAALPVQNIQTSLITLGAVVIPATLLGMVLATVLGITFTRPGAVSGRNIRDFSIAFIGWFIMNSLLWVYVRATASDVLFIDPSILLPLLVNIIAMIVLLLAKRWMALGAFSAFIVNAIGMILVAPSLIVVPYTFSSIRGILLMFPFFLPFFVTVLSSNYGRQKFPN